MKFSHQSLQFKLTLGYAVILITLIVALSFVLQTRLRSQLEEETLKHVEASGAQIVAELVRRTTLVHTLTESMANFVAHAEPDPQLMTNILPAMMDLAGEKSFIAGGGFWPEPFQFDKTKERHSFFWGRDKAGTLVYYDDYNVADGPGYHHEEWYVPARRVSPGSCYWSKSYIDPYSAQPMVTCTVPVNKQGKFVGATTIDLKLEGLKEFFEEQTKVTGGYAFAVDQNNKFITYPDDKKIKSTDGSENILASDLTKKDLRFQLISNELDNLNAELINKAKSNVQYDETIVAQLEQDSYQIDRNQAAIILSALLNPLHKKESLLLSRIFLEDDILTGEPVTVSVFHVPGAYWKVVVVTPQSKAFAAVKTIIEETLTQILLPLLVIMAIGFMGMRKLVIKPIKSITGKLRTSAENPELTAQHLDEERKDEFGQLAYWYNRRTRELADTMDELSSVNEELHYHANFDSLTDLVNRREFERKLKEVVEKGLWNIYALMYMDVDQFKVVNDTCGHAAGDQLLVQISEHLARITRDTDVVARIGGDEFALIVVTQDRSHTRQFAERIRESIEKIHFSWEGKSFSITCSIGVAQLMDVEEDPIAVMRHVDNACYAAKDRGRNRVHFYEPDDDVLTQREGEMNWISRINDALDNDLFDIHFQVISPTNLENQNQVGIEALIRMRGADGNLIPPGAFLPAAERYGAITSIDRWMIDNVLKLLKEHEDVLSRIKFCSINLSADSICHDGFIDFVRDRINFHRVPPNKLCFEVTETQVMLNLASAKMALQELQTIGSKVALDDFGSGMSSYGYLMELPIDLVKIDGRFVRDMKNDDVSLTFVRSINDIVTAMGLQTIAEFVEDLETYNLLQNMGVHYAQGYGIAKPQSIEKLSGFLDDKKHNSSQVRSIESK